MSAWVPKSGEIPDICALLLICNGFLGFTSGLTLADLLMANIVAESFDPLHFSSIGGTQTQHQVCNTMCALTI